MHVGMDTVRDVSIGVYESPRRAEMDLRMRDPPHADAQAHIPLGWAGVGQCTVPSLPSPVPIPLLEHQL